MAQPEVCQAFEQAPRAPAAGAPTVAMISEKPQAGLLFLEYAIALHVMDVFSDIPLLIAVRAKNPQEVWGAFCSSWIGVFGPPMSIRMDEGGGRKNKLRPQFRSERRIELLFQGVTGCPWIPERPKGLARAIFKRLWENDWFSGKQILAEAQRRLGTLIPGGGFSACQMVFGSDPADLCG